MTTSMTRFQQMLDAYDEIQKVIRRVEMKGINNIAVKRMSGMEKTRDTLANNGINTDRTAKQIRRCMDTWFKRFEPPKYSLEALIDGEWKEQDYNDEGMIITAVANLSVQNGYSVRIKNNINGDIYYNLDGDWVGI